MTSHKHYVRKFVKSFDFRVFTLEFAYKIAKKSTVICSFVSFISFILFATSRSQIFSTKTVSRFVLSSSNFSIATHKITSKSMKKLSINSLTFSISFFRTFVSKHQKFYVRLVLEIV